MFAKLNLTYLVISFCIGIGFVYFTTPPPTVVNKFPSPFNVDDTIYKNSEDKCYRYKSEKVNCSKHDNVVDQPIFENFK
jgi:hypothetical protein